MIIETCNCCGAPHEASNLERFPIELAPMPKFKFTVKAFLVCEECYEALAVKLGRDTNRINVFLIEVHKVFDIYAIADEGDNASRCRLEWQALAKLWDKWGLMGE